MDRNIIEGAERQHGLTTLARAASVSRIGLAKSELRSGRWASMALGVYRLRGAPQTWEQRVMALVLAAGPSAAASHRSAAGLLGIPGFRTVGRARGDHATRPPSP